MLHRVNGLTASDLDFPHLYARRNDAVSINRGVVDSLYLGRAHSVGHARQQANLLGCALRVNGLALYRDRQVCSGPLSRAA
jgi:hypothetical protein